MTIWTLIFRSLRFHARSHLGALLGAAIGSAVLIGALIVGDSVRGSLRDMALQRLGKIECALVGGDRLFRSALAHDLLSIGNSTTDGTVTPILTIPAMATRSDGSARANRVQLLGVETNIVRLGGDLRLANLPPGTVALNEALASHLRVQPGDTVIFRAEKASALSREAPISPQSESSIVLRLKVHCVIAAENLGNFNLAATQLTPFNAFVSLAELQKSAHAEGRANLLVGALEGSTLNPDYFKKVWRLEDVQAELKLLPAAQQIELRSERIFIDPALTEAALKNSDRVRGRPWTNSNAIDADQKLAAELTNVQPILTYFANQLRSGEYATPYSMVTATTAPRVPADLKEDEIVINEWLAEDLQARPGTEIEVTYFLPESAGHLVERTNRFRVRSVVPLSGPYADRTLMPEFPGITQAEKTQDWDAGFPLVHKIRPKDEQYWKEHRGTPKAFISLTAGQKLWGNRFGNLTAIRFPLLTVAQETDRVARTKQALEVKILSEVHPAQLGLRFEPVRERGLAAASQSEDFGGLFLGFSFFLIIAAVLLMALLFQFGLEQRAPEIGTLLALGFTPKRVRRLLLVEGAIISLGGGFIGAVGGIFFAKAMLQGLTTIWRSAVGTSSLQYHATGTSLAIGFTASFLISTLTIWAMLRKQARQPARQLLNEGSNSEIQNTASIKPKRQFAQWIALGCCSSAIGLLGWAISQKESHSAETFFFSGMLLLVGALAGCSVLLRKLAQSHAGNHVSMMAVALRNSTRRRKRSLTTIALLASGAFLIAAIGAFKLDSNQNAEKRSSGTGGFAFIGETTLPIVQHLNEAPGRDFFGLNERDLAGASFVPLRVHDGDDASCLNLNRAQKPRLLGVRPEELYSRKSFTFAGLAKSIPADQGWLSLSTTNIEEIPAIGDEASIAWALHKKIGDTLDYTDERGNVFRIRIVGAVANSILQGSLIIDEQAFTKKFPGDTGYRMFLIDAPRAQLPQLSRELSRGLKDVGLELTPANKRLAAFNAVQNTYLNTFQILGGLGLLLGSAGLGVVVLRNVLERRNELALLLAVGFRKRSLRMLVLSEHGVLLVLGLCIGIAAALLAVLPALISPRGDIPYESLAITLGAILLSGLLWTWVATRAALRGELLKALRNE
ncbi:MAG: FtsX-like permease family protein [Verrucomicrobiales bacterium]|nr:FtsX-like permease family protein [Verrucomicrobiales bacterium]